MKNIETKFISDMDTFYGIHKFLNDLQLSGTKNAPVEKGMLKQTDTYFNCRTGRLKLRIGENYELISYNRDENGDKNRISDYQRLLFSKEQFVGLKKIFRHAIGTMAVVEKVRILWLCKNTRIHLDSVKDLGYFIELETVINKINLKEAMAEHTEIINILKLDHLKRFAGSYCDMMLAEK